MFGHIWFNETNMAEAKTNGDVSKGNFQCDVYSMQHESRVKISILV